MLVGCAMRGWKTKALVVGSLVLVVACSAGGDEDPIADVAPADPSEGGVGLPPTSSSSSGAVDPDSGKIADAGKKETSVDAGPPPPDPGDPCTKVDDIVERKCGACGKQSAICQQGAGEAGALAWSQYSACAGELAGGCVPGTMATETCGNCGTRSKTCTQYCAWQNGVCNGQPANSCTPGAVELSPAGCTTANTFIKRSCSTTCSWGNFTPTCAAPPTSIEVPTSTGSSNFTYVVFQSSQTVKRLKGDCPSATFGTNITPYEYVSVHNPNATKATVTVFNSQTPGGPVFQTVLASYGATKPTTDVARQACVQGVAEFSDPATTGDDNFAALEDFQQVDIPANGTVWIYNAPYLPGSTGAVKLTVRLDKLQ